MTQQPTTAPARVLRWAVPVDDQVHEISHAGDVVHVACRHPRWVEFWTVEQDGAKARVHAYRVVGTGHHIDPGAVHVGTALAAYDLLGGPAQLPVLVWHLVEQVTS